MAATRKRSPKRKMWKIIQEQDNELRLLNQKREIEALRRNVQDASFEALNR